MSKIKSFFSNLDKKSLLTYIIPIATIIYFEIVLHFCTIGSINIRIFYPILFSIPCGIFIRILSGFFSSKANKVIYYILLAINTIYFLTQNVYFSIFGSFLSIFQFGMAGQVANNFGGKIVIGIVDSLPLDVLFLIPLVYTIILTKKKILVLSQRSIKRSLKSVAVCILCHLMCLIFLTFEGFGNASIFKIYFDSSTQTDVAIQNLGVITDTRLELVSFIFPRANELANDIIEGNENLPKPKETTAVTETTETTTTSDPKDTTAETTSADTTSILETTVIDPVDDEPVEYTSDKYNILNIDFEDMIKYETDKDIITLHKYFNNKTPTKKNEYTGIFEGYNLIEICAESFSPRLISEEVTPTLYKMYNNGFVFTNYYGSYESNTTNGEYSLCMGMFPDLSRDKVDNSFKATIKNYVPFCMGNMFDKKYGIESYAFHDYYGTYYQRNLTHPNMGYEFLAPDSGLDMDVYWPSSDLEMMEASIDEYLTTEEPFHAYYMTFSGHYQYNWNNPMSTKNRSSVTGLGYSSEVVQAYVSCNIELENALTYLLQRLEEAGVADKTVIVLTNDHYPYGLSEAEYNELSRETVDTSFEKYKNAFICYCPSMKENVIVDEPCCTIDILPTLLNLFGFDYDSRLICGIDVLSDSQHIAILSNQSFITKSFRFNFSNNKVEYFDQDLALTNEELSGYNNYVRNIFTVSSAILNNNYYAKFDYLFGDDVDPNYTYPPVETTETTASPPKS